MSLRILHGISALEAEKGGPSACVIALCEKLTRFADTPTLLSVVYNGSWNILRPSRAVELQLVRGRRMLGCGYCPAMRNWLRENAHRYDVIHGNGMWMMPNLYLRKAAVEAGKPFVISPHGMLQGCALQRSRWKKEIARRLYEDANLRAAACFHATSAAEAQSIRHYGLKQPVAVISHGVNLDGLEFRTNMKAGGPRCVVFLGRLHPHKGLETLLLAWSRLDGHPAARRLLIVGPGPQRYRQRLQREVEALRLQSSVALCGPVYGAGKSRLLAEAEVLVLPSKSENFGLVVAEALASGTPVIATRGTPWQELQQWGCGWWIEPGVEPLLKALQEALTLSPHGLARMGQRGRELVEKNYTWEKAAKQMAQMYRWLLGRAEKPRCIMG